MVCTLTLGSQGDQRLNLWRRAVSGSIELFCGGICSKRPMLLGFHCFFLVACCLFCCMFLAYRKKKEKNAKTCGRKVNLFVTDFKGQE